MTCSDDVEKRLNALRERDDIIDRRSEEENERLETLIVNLLHRIESLEKSKSVDALWERVFKAEKDVVGLKIAFASVQMSRDVSDRKIRRLEAKESWKKGLPGDPFKVTNEIPRSVIGSILGVAFGYLDEGPTDIISDSAGRHRTTWGIVREIAGNWHREKLK